MQRHTITNDVGVELGLCPGPVVTEWIELPDNCPVQLQQGWRFGYHDGWLTPLNGD